jgi:arylsulfatase A-like enzyme
MRILFLLWSVCLSIVLNAQSQPNILIIHTDDLGYHDLSCTGSKLYQTPNIDGLAQKSLRFDKAYSSYPRCTPSRYGMMTGTYPVNEDHGHLAGIPQDQNFVRLLKAAGYRSYFVGKWHLGDGENSPTGFGFDQSFAAGEAGATAQQFYPFNNPAKSHGEKPILDVEAAGKPGDYLSDLLTTKTMDFIRNTDKNKPFLAVLAFYSVHTPLEAKPDDRDRNARQVAGMDFGNTPEYIQEGTGRRKMRQDNPEYAGMVENVDENVGRLLALLKELSIDDNTIIVFSSDHGGLSNDGERKRLLATSNNPLRAGKGHLYEGGIRIPFIMHWKGKIKPGVDNTNIVLGMDVFPTLLDMAIGKKVEKIDGKSFYPAITGKEKWDNRTVFWHEEKARPHSTGDTKCSVIRSGDYKLLHFYAEGRIELYNIKNDISETTNLAEKEPELTQKLLAQLNDWKARYLVPEKMHMLKKTKKNSAPGEDEEVGKKKKNKKAKKEKKEKKQKGE